LATQKRDDPIVADGRERLRGEEWYRQKERAVREAVRKEYEPELAEASRYKRWVVRWELWRELRRQMDALAPERGLYLREPERSPRR
jgi:hypothetical protein